MFTVSHWKDNFLGVFPSHRRRHFVATLHVAAHTSFGLDPRVIPPGDAGFQTDGTFRTVTYSQVMTNIAIEHGRRNSEFSKKKIVMFHIC